MRLNAQQKAHIRLIEEDNDKLKKLSYSLINKIDDIFFTHMVLSIVLFFTIIFIINKIEKKSNT